MRGALRWCMLVLLALLALQLFFVARIAAMAWVDKIMTQTLILQHQQDH